MEAYDCFLPVPCTPTTNSSRFPQTSKWPIFSALRFISHIYVTFFQLILFFSKALLRHPKARSELSDMTGETSFLRYLPDTHPDNLVPPEQIKRHILCTGLCLLSDGLRSRR